MGTSFARVTAALWVCAMVGCGGDSSSPSSPEMGAAEPGPAPTPVPAPPTPEAPAQCQAPFDDGEVIVAVLELLGAPSRNGRGSDALTPVRTTKHVLVRVHAGQVEILDFGGDGAPERRGPIFFSAPETAWAWTTPALYPLAESALVRSRDAGVTWESIGQMPAARRWLDLVVDEERGKTWSVHFFENLGSFGTPGPYVYVGDLTTNQWTQVEDILPAPWLEPIYMALFDRGDRIEVLRLSTDRPLEAYDITGPIAVSELDIDERFTLGTHATHGERAWIMGRVDDRRAMLISDAPGNWDLVFPEADETAAFTYLDFSDQDHGLACGPVTCETTSDGGATWVSGDVPDLSFQTIRGVARSSCARGGVAVASTRWWFRDPAASVLLTTDGGQVWSPRPLPRLADGMEVGPPVSNAQAELPTEGFVPPPANAIELPVPPAPVASDHPGPVFWAVGDSVAHGPAIVGLLLRSTDGGHTWDEVFGQPGGSFTGLDFVDRTTGWVVGGGRIFRTEDGGTTFLDLTSQVGLDEDLWEARVVSAPDADRALVVGSRSAGNGAATDLVLVTEDGGQSWSVAELPSAIRSNSDLGPACIGSDGFGMLMNRTQLLLTSDGGATWELAAESVANSGPDDFDEPQLLCPIASDLFIVADGNRDDALWHSPDGGRTWRERSREVGLVPSFRARSVGTMLPSGRGWIIVQEAEGPPMPARTEDGGRRWQVLPSPFEGVDYPETIAFGEDGTGVVLTTDGEAFVTADGGDTWDLGALPEGLMPLGSDAVP